MMKIIKKTKEKKPVNQPKADPDLLRRRKAVAENKAKAPKKKEPVKPEKTIYPPAFSKTIDKSGVERGSKIQTCLAESKIPRKGGGVYYFAVGRRKSAVAKVQLLKNGNDEIIVNGRDVKQYFPWNPLYEEVVAPLLAVGQKDKLNAKCVISGGGAHSQAEAARLGISRALLKLNPVFRRALKKHGFLTRDPRVKERKKYGLKRARRAPQWVKR